MSDEARTPRQTPAPRGPRRGLLIGAFVAVLAIASVPIAAAVLSDSDSAKPRIDTSKARQLVLAALDATISAGSYDMTFTNHVSAIGRSSVDVSGHGTVNLDPYAMVAVSEVSGLGSITIYVNGTTVWELGGGNYGSAGGQPLSGFADLVESTLGPAQGAVAMINLASRTGYLNLEHAAIRGAQEVGTGTVDGTAVTYYDVTIDVTGLADAPDLTEEQRATIARALPLLASAGYAGTDERIGIDDAGFIREVTATERFSDGSAYTRHTILSNFGCAAKVTMPDEQPAAATAPTTTCTSSEPTTTTTEAPTSTTTSATTSTTSAPTTTSSTTTSTTPPTTSTATP